MLFITGGNVATFLEKGVIVRGLDLQERIVLKKARVLAVQPPDISWVFRLLVWLLVVSVWSCSWLKRIFNITSVDSSNTSLLYFIYRIRKRSMIMLLVA